MRSPPSTAAIPADFSAAAFAISMPRARTNFMASISLITPASAAAVISPTECPATTINLESDSARAPNRPAATISGWAFAVSLISSASAVVPSLTKSKLISADQALSNSSASGSAIQGVNIPGVCVP